MLGCVCGSSGSDSAGVAAGILVLACVGVAFGDSACICVYGYKRLHAISESVGVSTSF